MKKHYCIAAFTSLLFTGGALATGEVEDCHLHERVGEPDEGLSLVRADFNGDGVEDEAHLVVCENSSPNTLRFEIILSGQDSAREVSIGYDIENLDIYLRLVKVGSQVEQSGALGGLGITAIVAAYPSLELVYVGKAAIAYVWSEQVGKMISIQTAD